MGVTPFLADIMDVSLHMALSIGSMPNAIAIDTHASAVASNVLVMSDVSDWIFTVQVTFLRICTCT